MHVKGTAPFEILPIKDDACLRAYLQVAQLKRLYRQGWLKRGVPPTDCESVADHVFGLALLALLAPAPVTVGFDRAKAVVLALVHELGEVYAGDITPVDGVSAEDKRARERDGLKRVLDGHPDAAGLAAAWEEFEAGSSPEARWIRQLDRLEMGIQAAVYRAEGRPNMEEFIASAERAVDDPSLSAVLERVLR